MRDNEGGGKTVLLTPGDSLRKVPRSHRHLLTPAIREAFADPTQYFHRVADNCRFDAMARWLRAMLAEGPWQLKLHRGYGPSEAAGFYWHADSVRPATVAPAGAADLSAYPPDLRDYFSLVDAMDWMGFGCPGKLSGADDFHNPLTAYRLSYHGAAVPLDSTFVWGTDAGGNMLVYTSDGRGGWVNLGSHEVRLLGSVADTVEWVYSQLLAGQGPAWDYRHWGGDQS